MTEVEASGEEVLGTLARDGLVMIDPVALVRLSEAELLALHRWLRGSNLSAAASER